MGTRVFTPSSARREIEGLRPAAAHMRGLVRRMERLAAPVPQGDRAVSPAYFILVRRLRDTIAVVERSGAKVRDPRRGRIEFPARRAGRPVVLCWSIGERDLAFWLDPGDRDAGLRPVDEGPWESGRDDRA